MTEQSPLATAALQPGEPPKDRVFYARYHVAMKWTPYKPGSDQARRGIPGRWQSLKPYGIGWQNSDVKPKAGAWVEDVINNPPPPYDPSAPGVVHRTGPLTVRDYDEAITDLLAAKHALQRGETGGCDVCGSDEHWPSECPHNPLRLARQAVAAQSVYRCWHCGYEARTDAEGLEHFGRTEFEEPACRRPFRTMDAIDAEREGARWIEAIGHVAVERDGEPVFIESQSRAGQDWYMALYQRTKLIACAFVFRDPMNCSVLIRWLPAVGGGDASERDEDRDIHVELREASNLLASDGNLDLKYACIEASNLLLSQTASIERLRRILHRYGDRVPMATNARPDWQQEIDEAFEWVANNPEPAA